MSSRTERAKDLYFRYGSSKFQMMRDGFSQEYLSYNISEEQEMLWLDELIKLEIRKLDINDTGTLFPLWYILETNDETDHFPILIDFIKMNENYSDSENNFLKFTERILYTIENIAKSKPNYNTILKSYIADINKLRKKYL